MGEPIYFVKWETGAAAPVLLRVQSIGDVELFGIDGANYNALVLERGAWEARTGRFLGAQQLARLLVEHDRIERGRQLHGGRELA